MLKVQPNEAEGFFANPDLDPYQADRVAHDWLEEHRRLSQDKGLKKGMALAKQAMIVPALQAHKRWSEKNHYNPTSSFREIKEIKRQERTAKKLPSWEKLFSDEGFEEEIESRGLKGDYDRMIKLGADKEEVRNQYRRKLFVRDLAGKNNDVLQAKVAKGILGLQDSSDEAFLQGAKGWVGERARKRDHAKSGFDSGVASFLSKGSDFGADLSAQKEVSKEAGEAFSRAHRAMREDYGHILPLARGLVSEKEAEGTRGLFESVEAPPVNIAKIIDLYENGEREKFLYMLGKVSELEGGEVDGGITKFSKSISRGVGNIAGGIERKIDRLRNESNKGKISDDEYQREKHYLQFKRDISNLKAEVAKIDSDSMVVQGIYDAGQSVPYMAMMATGLGMGMAALSIQEQHMEEIVSQDPSVDPDKALWVSTVSAPIEVGIERLQFGVLRGKFPGIQKAVDKLTKGGLMRRITAVTAAEYTQETIQDAVLPTVQDIANDLGAEIPEGDWSNFKVMDARRFFAVLPLSILGGGGQYARDKFTASEVRSELVDPDKIRMSGGTIAEAKEIANLAKSNPDAALQKFKDVVLSKPVEERNKLGDEATDEIFSQELKDGLEGLPVVLPQSDGGLKVKFGDGREEVASSPAEAQALVDQHFQEEFVSNAEAVTDFIGGLKERAEGDNKVKEVEKITLQDIADRGEQTAENLKKAVAVYHAQMGEVAPDRIDLKNYSEQGSVRMRRKMAGFSVRIAKGANPLTVAEEFSEGFVRMVVGQGETTFEEVKGLLDEFGDASGLKMTQGYDVDPERAVIEGFSKFAKAYMLQGKYDALPDSVQAWSAKAWRIMENPESLPAPLRAAVEFFTKLLRSVYDVAKAIEFHKKDGAGIDPELEGLAMRALGLDEKGYTERMEEQYRKELLDDVFSPSEELSERVKGRLPHPDDMKGDPLHGELKEIWDSMSKETRRKKKDGSRVMSDAKARGFFADKGQGEDLDDLRQSLNDDGFRFTTPAEMLGAIQESVEGENVWPAGQEEVAGYDTFSITQPQIEEIKSSHYISKASAATKRLKTLYRGSSNGALNDNFDVAQWGSGLYFTANKEMASEYGEVEEIPLSVIPENPLVFDDENTAKTWLGLVVQRRVLGQRAREFSKEFPDVATFIRDELGYDGVQIGQGKNAMWVSYPEEQGGRVTFSISPTGNATSEAIDRLFSGPSGLVDTGKKLRAKLAKVREKFEANMFGGQFQDKDTRSLETLNALMQLNAIASVLPKEVRHVVGSPVSLVSLKTEKARERNVIRRLDKIAEALEVHLKKAHLLKIRKLIDKSSAKVDKQSRRAKSKIGAASHEINKAAVEAMVMEPKEAEGRADGIRADLELVEELTLDKFEEMEGRAMAFELFADFENADSARMERMIEFLERNYSAGREEWVKVLGERKRKRESRVNSLREAIGATDFTGFSEITKSNKKNSATRQFSQEFLSFYQLTDFLAEKTENPKYRAAVKELQDAFRHSRNSFEDNLEERQEAINSGVAEILGVRGSVNKFARLNSRLVSLSKPFSVNASVIVGRKVEEISVPKDRVELILRGELNQIGETVFDESDVELFQKAWDDFEMLPEKAQNRKRVIKVERVVAQGKRVPIGELSQLDLLKEWLAMEQHDAAKKYKKGGWDSRTKMEIFRELSPEVRRLGRYVQGYLRDMTPSVDAIHRSEYGLALPAVENYFPLLFNVAGNDTEISMDGHNVSVSARKGSFLKSRVSHAAMPKQANALAVLQSHLASVEFWKTHAPVLREWGGVLRDQKLQHAMQAKMGTEFVTSLNSWLKMIESNGRDQSLVNLVADKLVQKLQGGLSLSVLGMRLRTVMVNATASLNVTLQVPLTKLLKGLRPELLGDIKDLVKSPTFQRRLKSGGSYEARVALEQRSGGGLVSTTLRRAAQLGMQPINLVDTLTNLTSALAYRAHVVEGRKAGLTERQAKESALDYVDDIITRVAQPVDAVSRSLFENKIKGTYGGLVFLFASEARKNTSLMFLAGRKMMTGKGVQSRGMAAQQLLMGFIAYSTLGYALKSFVEVFTKPEDDDEDAGERFLEKMTDQKALVNAMATEHMRGIPLLGEGWSAAMAQTINALPLEGEKIKTFDGSANPLLRIMKSTTKVSKAVKAENHDERADAIIDSFQGFGAITPATSIFSQLGNVSEDALGFYRGILGGSLSEGGAIEVFKRKLRKTKESIYEPDREAYKTAKGSSRSDIEMRREEALVDHLESEISQMSPSVKSGFLKDLEKEELVPKSVLKRISPD